MATSIDRPRYRRHRRYSDKFAAFLDAMVAKWSGHETPIAVSAVGSDVLALGDTPDCSGPWSLRGVRPPELRDLDRYWVSVDGSDNATFYSSRRALADGHSIDVDTWDLSPDWTALGTPVAIEAVTNANEQWKVTGHGYAVGDGPFYVASDDTLPAGSAATTPYWIQAVPDADHFTLSASKGGAVLPLTTDGAGNITITPVNVDVSLDTIEVVGHGMATGEGPFQLTTGGGLPTGAVVLTDYWAIKLTDDRFKLATSYANAIAGTPVNLTGIGTGTSTVNRALEIGKDLSEGGIVEWLAQGVSRGNMSETDVGDLDDVFTD